MNARISSSLTTVNVSGHVHRVSLLWPDTTARRILADQDEVRDACEVGSFDRTSGFIPVGEVGVMHASEDVVGEIDPARDETIDETNLDPLDILLIREERKLLGIDEDDESLEVFPDEHERDYEAPDYSGLLGVAFLGDESLRVSQMGGDNFRTKSASMRHEKDHTTRRTKGKAYRIAFVYDEDDGRVRRMVVLETVKKTSCHHSHGLRGKKPPRFQEGPRTKNPRSADTRSIRRAVVEEVTIDMDWILWHCGLEVRV